ncbi:MAG: hypothetical protein K0R57_124 [Paenibacillaceae bacterium]|jgi:AraC-like DNA-binding protein|nr:hypothetical protein [Paenibacillaceae bacterium]
MIVVPELYQIWHYQAPRGGSHVPRVIEEGQQDIEIFVSGRGFFEHEGSLIEATTGTVLWHIPGDTTIYMRDPESPYACIVVTLLDQSARPLPRISQWTDRTSFRPFIDRILTEFHSESPDLKKLACYIYGQLYWHCQAPVDTSHTNSKRNREMKRVTDWIEEHYAEDIHLEQLAGLSGVSLPHLHTLFKQYADKTPYQFIQARRLQEAKILLASTLLPVKEVAARSGFRDVGNFCRVFKQSSGATAQEFRLQHMDNRLS